MNEAPRRARTMAEFREIQGHLGDVQEMTASIQSYRPRPSDVVIAPFGKCGTTWLQQIFHCARTRGDTNFDDISRVVPWIETARVAGLDLEAPQRGEPRGFKSHLPYDAIPKGARYIVAFRDPKDALVSGYRFMEGWFIEPGTVTIEDYAERWLASGAIRGGDYWSHLISWWEQHTNPQVLLLCYEHMIKDVESSIRSVVDFCGLPLDDDLLAMTMEQSSLEYMLEHKNQFDDLLMREAAERLCNLPSGGDSSKVRKGGVGGHRHELPAQIADRMDARWAELIEPRLGFADYTSLERAIR